MPRTEQVYALGPHTIDLAGRTVTCAGVPLKLAWRHFEALKLLVEANQQVVAREQFFRSLWPGVDIVDESNLTQCISQLRRTLGNGEPTPLIETVPRLGYRLTAPAITLAPHQTAHAREGSDEPTQAAGAPAIDKRGARGSRLAWVTALVVIAAIGGASATWWWQRPRPEQLAREAQARANEFTRRADAKAAVEELQHAVQLDPTNALAHAELALALNRLSFRDSIATPVGESPSVIAATRAVELDSQCAGCHGTLGFFLFYHDWRWSDAESHLERALRLAPGRHSNRPPYAMLLAATGRLRDALDQIDLALNSQPLEVGWHAIRAAILYLDRRYDESIAATDRAMAITQDERAPWEWRSKALFQLGRGEEAVKALAQVAFASHSLELDAAVREGGREAGLRRLLEVTGDWRSQKSQAWRRAPWRALLGDTEGALAELEAAYELRNVNLIYLGVDPVYDKIRDEPRFQRILRGMGLPAGTTRE